MKYFFISRRGLCAALSRGLRAALSLGIATAVQSHGIGAQTRRLSDASDSIPRSLAEAVIDPMGTMRMMAGGRPRLVVGTLPAGLARRLWLPPGSTILGGIESSGFGLAIIRAPMSADSLAAAFNREQPKLGWTLPPARTGLSAGFVSASQVPNTNNNGTPTFCSGGTTLTIGITPIDPMTWEIRATAMDFANAICHPPTIPRVIPGRTDYPTLINPPATGNGFGVPCGNFNSTGGGTTRLQTRMSATDVLAHYAKQLTDSGWTASPTEILSRTWTRTDTSGALVELTLRTRSQPAMPDCVEVQMDVRSRRPPG